MSRDLTTDVATAAAASEVRPAFFVFLDLDSGPVRVWSGVDDFDLDGNTFTGIGTIGGISPITESTRVVAHGIELSLSGIPSAYVSLALSEHYRGRLVYVWLAFFDADGVLIADAVQIFAGRIDTMGIQDTGETSTLTLSAESQLIDLERPRELRYTDEEQKRLFPGDRGLEYVAGLQDKPLHWGVANPPLPAGSYDPGSDMSEAY